MRFMMFEKWEREREKTCSRADWGRGDWVCVSEVFLEREGLISECCLLSGFERVRWRLHESMALPQWETLLMTILALSYFSSIFFLSLNKFFLFFFSLALASPCLPTCLTSIFRPFFIFKQVLLPCYFLGIILGFCLFK